MNKPREGSKFMSIRTNQLLNQSRPPSRAMAPRRQRGAIAIMAVVLLPVLLAVGALVIDIANLMLVKGELQNAADAAAQAGAQCLYPSARNTSSCQPTGARPDFLAAERVAKETASSAVPRNAVQGALVLDSVQTGGYWNTDGTPETLQSQSITPKKYDYPAVQVTIGGFKHEVQR